MKVRFADEQEKITPARTKMFLIFLKINIFSIGKKFWKLQVFLLRFPLFAARFEHSKREFERAFDKKVSQNRQISKLDIPDFHNFASPKPRIIEIHHARR